MRLIYSRDACPFCTCAAAIGAIPAEHVPSDVISPFRPSIDTGCIGPGGDHGGNGVQIEGDPGKSLRPAYPRPYSEPLTLPSKQVSLARCEGSDERPVNPIRFNKYGSNLWQTYPDQRNPQA